MCGGVLIVFGCVNDVVRWTDTGVMMCALVPNNFACHACEHCFIIYRLGCN